jgi:hypothetical protein
MMGRRFAALTFALALFGGCVYDEEEDTYCIIVDSCSGHIPDEANLRFEISDHLDELEVRSGPVFETGRLVWRGQSTTGMILPLGRYTARARYVNGGDTVLAIDGGVLAFSETEECGETCYKPEDATLDLALKPGVWSYRQSRMYSAAAI